MEPDQVRTRPLRVLSATQREQYFADGWVAVAGLVDAAWITRLREVTTAFVELSRHQAVSNAQFDLEPNHSYAEPRIRRLNSPVGQHPLYWEFAAQSVLVDVVEDLIGPDIKFHHGKLNFKAPRGGEEVKWHQDIQFWPHTNYSPLSIGVFLDDVTAGQGEVGFVSGSHAGELFNLYAADEPDRWVGSISAADLARVDTANAVYPLGPAGTITIHNCRTIHGSAPNDSDRPRPLLLQTYAAADAFTYTDTVRAAPHANEVIRGQPARWAHHDPRPCLMPPTRVGTIFQAQQRELDSRAAR